MHADERGSPRCEPRGRNDLRGSADHAPSFRAPQPPCSPRRNRPVRGSRPRRTRRSPRTPRSEPARKPRSPRANLNGRTHRSCPARPLSGTFARSASTRDTKAPGTTPGPSSISRSSIAYETAPDVATSRRVAVAMHRFLRIVAIVNSRAARRSDRRLSSRLQRSVERLARLAPVVEVLQPNDGGRATSEQAARGVNDRKDP